MDITDREGDHNVFEELFFEYFYDRCSYAVQITKSQQKTKDIVQEVFYKLWKRRQQWDVHTSLKAYLYRSVRNEALNKLNREQHRNDLDEELKLYKEGRRRYPSYKREKVDQELLNKIWSVVSEMPGRSSLRARKGGDHERVDGSAKFSGGDQ